jgi:plastocyanin
MRQERFVNNPKGARMHPRRWLFAACTVAALVVGSGAADAATRSVYMGTPPQAGRSFERLLTDINDFFPHTTTIRQGDSVRFVPVGFHNVDLPAREDDPLPLASPTGQKIAGINDAANAPFWFNGQDQLGFTRELGESGFGKRFTYDGSERVNSGLPLAERPRPMTVRFDRRGSFTYLCNVHAGMKGRVRVRGDSSDAPTTREHNRAVTRQIARARTVARDLDELDAPANTFNVGAAGAGGVERLAFVPERLQVARGTTVTFRMSPRSYDVHTATSGPGDPENQPSSYLGQIAASFQQPVFDQRGAYGSEPPGTVASLSATLHGNGFWNTGVMDTTSATPLPRSGRVRLDTAGSYTFYCLIHPFMKGTVDVS